MEGSFSIEEDQDLGGEPAQVSAAPANDALSPESAPAPAPAPAPGPAGSVGGGATRRVITRELVVQCFSRPDIAAKKLGVERHMRVVDLLRKAMGLPVTQTAYERCWRALDLFLVGKDPIDDVAQGGRFDRLLRTVNFCIDLYGDYCSRRLTSHEYLSTRRQLINAEHVHRVEVGRYRIPMNDFRRMQIMIHQMGDDPLTVNAIVSLEPKVVYAMKANDVKTLFGRLVKAEIVEPMMNDKYQVTGRQVILKFYEKGRLGEVAKSREDPFKEIVALQLFRGAPGLPTVVDVLEDPATFIKVESDCGTSLFDIVTAHIDRRIPENWIVHMLKQLVQGLYVMHSKGFVHLDISLENTMFQQATQKAYIIDFGFVTRIQRDAKGAALPFPAGLLKVTGKNLACGPELYQTHLPVDGCKVDVFALGSVLFSLVTKDKPFDKAIASDSGWNMFTTGRVEEHLTGLVKTNFGQEETVSKEMVNLITAAMHPDPRRRATVVGLAQLIVKHQQVHPPP